MSLLTVPRRCALAGALLLGAALPAAAAGPALDAAASDPVALGWMQGFPPPDDKLIGQPDAD